MDTTDSDNFTNIMLRLKIGDVERPLRPLGAVQAKSANVQCYRAQYTTLVIDDARASIEAAMQALSEPVNEVVLNRDVRQPSGGNFCTFSFTGELKSTEDGARSMNLVILSCSVMGESVRFFALATVCSPNGIKIKATPSQSALNQAAFQLREGSKWGVQYVTNLTTHERIFNACNSLKCSSPLLKNIMRGSAYAIPPVGRQVAAAEAAASGQNAIQNHAIQAFCKMPTDNVMLLQGPPGTGKTSTVVRLLAQLTTTQRVLVCAASNKAVQELAARFFEKHGSTARMVLAGVESKIPEHLRCISLRSILSGVTQAFSDLRAELHKTSGSFYEEVRVDTIVRSVGSLTGVSEAMKWLQSYDALPGRIDREYRLLSEHWSRLQSFLPVSSRSQSFYEVLLMVLSALNRLLILTNEEQDRIELRILNNSQVVFCTLSTAGGVALCGRSGVGSSNGRAAMKAVDVLIVDEAGQTVEAETLIPLQHGPKRMLLVGDIKQLPATVISQPAKDHFYDWSMMYRLQEKCGQPKITLTTQYRMHPEICAFPSRQYYDGQLITAPSCTRYTSLPNNLYQPVAFYSMSAKGNEEEKDGTSRYNAKEVKFVAQCVQYFCEVYPDKQIGVITFYDAQKQRILQKLGNPLPAKVVVGSVDGFQGSECDVIIVSFVRHNRSGNVGFVDDFRRLNVAITRAKDVLIMIGCTKTLSKHSTELAALISHTKATGSWYEENVLRARLAAPPVRVQFVPAPAEQTAPAMPAPVRAPAQAAARPDLPRRARPHEAPVPPPPAPPRVPAPAPPPPSRVPASAPAPIPAPARAIPAPRVRVTHNPRAVGVEAEGNMECFACCRIM